MVRHYKPVKNPQTPCAGHPRTKGALTARQKVLLAATGLEAEGYKPFTANNLVRAAWVAHPETFGLTPYDLPDSNAVLSLLMGRERGLVHDGYLLKTGKKLYELTAAGHAEARRLRAGGTGVGPNGSSGHRRGLATVQAPKALGERLSAMLLTAAYRRFLEGSKREINYGDARAFWSLSTETVGEQVDRTLAVATAAVEDARKLLTGDGLPLAGGQTVSAADLSNLAALHAWLTVQFARNLKSQREAAFRRIA